MDAGIGNRVALVTGASRGIGRACADALYKEGAIVCGVSLHGMVPSGPSEDYSRDRMISLTADLGTESGCTEAVEKCVRMAGEPTILVNCAGAAGGGSVLDIDCDTLERSWRVKFFGYLRLAQLVAPYMISAKWGRIVNVSGGAGSSPTSENLASGVPNASVHCATRALSDKLAPHGVLVNLVSPGVTLTDRTRSMASQKAEREGRDPESVLHALGSATPAGRLADPNDVANAVCFFASDYCRYVFGSVLYLDGGSRRALP